MPLRRGMLSAKDSLLLADVLNIKAALDAGQPLESLQLHSPYGPPRLDIAAVGGDAYKMCVTDLLEHLTESTLGLELERERPLEQTLLHRAVATYWSGRKGTLQLLLAAAPAAIEIRSGQGETPVHKAIWLNSGALQPMLEASPGAALVKDRQGMTAVAWALKRPASKAAVLLLEAVVAAAAEAEEDSLALLSQVAFFKPPSDKSNGQPDASLQHALPRAATTADAQGRTLLHHAAKHRCHTALRLLLAAGWGDPASVDTSGQTPLHAAAAKSNSAAVELLLQAAPITASAIDGTGRTALHWAVGSIKSDAAIVGQLLQAAPQVASAKGFLSRTPLEVALLKIKVLGSKSQDLVQPRAIAACLLPFYPAARALAALAAAAPFAQPLFAAFINLHAPLTSSEWQLVPSPCTGLDRALPAAMAHSPEQAAQLVKRLPAADKQRLRSCIPTAALTLTHAQRAHAIHPPLPPPIVHRILSHLLT